MKKYTYDAFISYRHTELDKFVAENLHKMLEAFRLPGNVAKKKTEGRTRIERVFRDKEELPLTSNLEDPIMQALSKSEYLIVICSPRLRESLWCRKEIETFIGMHGREKVLAVLIEGEPHESFPEELLYVNETVQKPDGTTEVVKKPMEPLAADVRGKNKKDMLKAMRTEILRLLAPMFDLGYDDLRQRHRERKMKRILAASLTGAAVCLGFGAFSTAMALRIHSQKEQIEAQNLEIQAKTSEIQLQNSRLMENQAENQAEEALRQLENGDRIGAINTAVSALTEYDGIAMPYTAEAQYALTKSLYVYDNGYSIKPLYQLKTAGVISFMSVSPDRKNVLTYDASGALTIWNAQDGTMLAEIRGEQSALSESSCVFLDGNRVGYMTLDGLNVYNIEEQTTTLHLEEDNVYNIYADKTGKNLVGIAWDKMYLYDADTLEKIAEYELEEDKKLGSDFLFDDTGRYLVFQQYVPESDYYTQEEKELYFWDLEENIISKPISVGTNYLQAVQFKGDTAYVLLNHIGSDLMYSELTLLACDAKTGKVLWKQLYEDKFGSYLFKSGAENAETMLLCTSYEAWLISLKDGTIKTNIPLGNDTAGVAVSVDTDLYFLYARNGELVTIFGDTGDSYTREGFFRSHSQNVKDFRACIGGFLVLPYQDNAVTVYNFSAGPDLTEYQGEVPQMPEAMFQQDSVAYARELGLEKAELTRRLFFNEDNSLMGVYYADSTLEIYSTQDNTLISSIDNVGDEVMAFFGTDIQGNTYVAGYSVGYILNPEYELIGEIDSFEGLCEDGENLILSDYGTYYTVPIYTVEELLAIAESYVIK